MHLAIIDDGVNEMAFQSPFKLKENVVITEELSVIQRRNYNSGELSHGTICAAIISQYTDLKEFSSIKILEGKKRGGLKQLLKALLFCVEIKVDIIHLSIGSTNYRDYKSLLFIVNKLYEKGILIVAAAANSNKYSILAEMENIIGVEYDEELCFSQYYAKDFKTDNIDFAASSKHKLFTKEGEIFQTTVCNSYSAPVITAQLYELLKSGQEANIRKIKTQLAAQGLPTTNRKFQFAKSPYFLGNTTVFSDKPINDNYLWYNVKQIYPLNQIRQENINTPDVIILNGDSKYDSNITSVLNSKNSSLKGVILLNGIEMFLLSNDKVRIHLRSSRRRCNKLLVEAINEPPIIIIKGCWDLALTALKKLAHLFESDGYATYEASDYELGFLYGLEKFYLDSQFNEMIQEINYLQCDLVLYLSQYQKSKLEEDVAVKVESSEEYVVVTNIGSQLHCATIKEVYNIIVSCYE